MFEIGNLHKLIRDVPKPVIAAVNGIAVGGGHVLHVLCDLTIASENAKFGQAGPRVGSFDAGFGSAFLARIVGEKRAREIWYLCRQYDAPTAERWGLVNWVVPQDKLLDEAKAVVAEIAEKSPTAIRFLKQSFNADTDHQAGLSNLAMSALDLFGKSDEGLEGAKHSPRSGPPSSQSTSRPDRLLHPERTIHMSNIALVTGAGSGIGKSIALAFAAQGDKVIAADLDLAAAEATAKENPDLITALPSTSPTAPRWTPSANTPTRRSASPTSSSTLQDGTGPTSSSMPPPNSRRRSWRSTTSVR